MTRRLEGEFPLMLVAAGKVFLLDAAGLDGVARIGSFVALGFSLLGIGWLYTRFVTVANRDEPEQGLAHRLSRPFEQRG